MKAISSIGHIASLAAWVVTLAACFALFLPAKGSISQVLLPSLSAVASTISISDDAVSELRQIEPHQQVAAVTPTVDPTN